MKRPDPFLSTSLDSNVKVFHELMQRKVHDILLVSTPYDAWIMEEDGRLSERIVNEYRGLNLSKPPRLTWASSAEEALALLDEKHFDMVITMPRVADANAFALGHRIKEKHGRDLPVILLTHGLTPIAQEIADRAHMSGIDRAFVWSGNTELLVAIVKSTEDRWNVEHDTAVAGVRVILYIENSPIYSSALLPLLYRELVQQTRAVLEGQLNEEQRLLTMRARPKILISNNYEEAMALFERYEAYVLGVISDVQFPREGVLDRSAGFDLLGEIKRRRFDIPLLITSVDPKNAARAAELSAAFIDKNSPNLEEEIHNFFQYSLAFGDFIFRMPDGTEVARASDLRSLERCLRIIPAESLVYHGERNDFSRWLFTRTETVLASRIRDWTVSDFESPEELRRHLIQLVHQRRKERQMGIVADFDPSEFDWVTRFVKIGQGSLGGKARGLAFMSALLQRDPSLRQRFEDVRIFIPRTLVITTDAFEEFVGQNNLGHFATIDADDKEVAAAFLQARLPEHLENDLRAYLTHVHYPLAVRSSSLLEDAHFHAYAGMYRTYMLPNEHPNIDVRVGHLIHAIKLVYASTYYRAPKAYSRRVGRRTEEEKMAVIVQQLVGERYGNFFYPAISGVAQSYNYYPFARMKPEDGIANIALGFGIAVVEGEKTLRFCPAHPTIWPDRASVDAILENSQRYFYALKMGEDYHALDIGSGENLVRREVADAVDEPPVKFLCSTYIPSEHRIRDTTAIPGPRVLTFANVLKYKKIPLADLLVDLLDMGEAGLGTAVELEFSVNLRQDQRCKPEFAILQLRPMSARAELRDVDITEADIAAAFCYSTRALGNVIKRDVADIIYVKPDSFDPAATRAIAHEINRLNAMLNGSGRRFLLIGPGRWGTADPWLGIPVRWADISAVSAIVEAPHERLNAEPSQGSHFFYNLTTLGINYFTVVGRNDGFIHWDWLLSQPIANETERVAHVRLETPLLIKVDGRSSRGVIIPGQTRESTPLSTP